MRMLNDMFSEILAYDPTLKITALEANEIIKWHIAACFEKGYIEDLLPYVRAYIIEHNLKQQVHDSLELLYPKTKKADNNDN